MFADQPNLEATTTAGESVRRPLTATFSTRSPSTCARGGGWDMGRDSSEERDEGRECFSTQPLSTCGQKTANSGTGQVMQHLFRPSAPQRPSISATPHSAARSEQWLRSHPPLLCSGDTHSYSTHQPHPTHLLHVVSQRLQLRGGRLNRLLVLLCRCVARMQRFTNMTFPPPLLLGQVPAATQYLDAALAAAASMVLATTKPPLSNPTYRSHPAAGPPG